jgi:tetratricopeptide (TPR) repeat protein
MGKDMLPDDVTSGMLKYIVQAHPDPKTRKEYMELLKEFEEREGHEQALQETISLLKSAEPGSQQAEEAADELLGVVPLTAGVDKAISVAFLAAKAGFPEKALEFLEPRLGREDLSEADKALLFAGMGDIGMVQDPSIAAAYYERAMELDPKCVKALVGLAKVHQAEERWDDALAVLRKGIALTAGKPEEALVLMGLADVLKEMGQWDQAERYVRRVRSLNPRDKNAIRFYEDYYTAKQDWQRLYSTLQFHLSIEKDPTERVKITKRLSSMALDKLGSKDRAADVLKRLVLMDPQDEESRERLFQVYEEAGKWRALVELCNDLVRKLPSNAVDQKVDLLRRIVHLYEDPDKLNNPDMALNTYARILQFDPEDRDALARLAQGYEARGNWSELLMVLKQQAETVTDPKKQLDLYHKIVEIGLGKLSNERVALPYLERILDIEPEDKDAMVHLVSAYEHKREYEKLLEILGRLIPLTEGDEREKYLYKAAITAKERLGLSSEALDYYEELYTLNPTIREAREVLHQLYTKLGEWERYAKFLEEEVTRPMPDRRKVELLGKLGEIKMDRLDDPNGARRLFEAALEIQPHDVLAQRRLEEIYIAQEDFEALKGTLKKKGQLRGYVNMLSERELKEENPERKVSLALEMARTCEEDLGDLERAIRYYNRAYAIDPSLSHVGRRLVDYYRDRGHTDREIEILMRMVEHIDDIGMEREARERLFTSFLK